MWHQPFCLIFLPFPSAIARKSLRSEMQAQGNRLCCPINYSCSSKFEDQWIFSESTESIYLKTMYSRLCRDPTSIPWGVNLISRLLRRWLGSGKNFAGGCTLIIESLTGRFLIKTADYETQSGRTENTMNDISRYSQRRFFKINRRYAVLKTNGQEHVIYICTQNARGAVEAAHIDLSVWQDMSLYH